MTIPTGVLTIVLSMTVMEPTSWSDDPPAEMSMPFPQLLIDRPMYVQPQSQSWMMAAMDQFHVII